MTSTRSTEPNRGGEMLRITPAGVTTVVLEGMDPVQIAAAGSTVCWTSRHWMTFGGLGDVICLLDVGG